MHDRAARSVNNFVIERFFNLHRSRVDLDCDFLDPSALGRVQIPPINRTGYNFGLCSKITLESTKPAGCA